MSSSKVANSNGASYTRGGGSRERKVAGPRRRERSTANVLTLCLRLAAEQFSAEVEHPGWAESALFQLAQCQDAALEVRPGGACQHRGIASAHQHRLATSEACRVVGAYTQARQVVERCFDRHKERKQRVPT